MKLTKQIMETIAKTIECTAKKANERDSFTVYSFYKPEKPKMVENVKKLK